MIRSFISAYGTEQKVKKQRQKEEMQALKDQILMQVQELVKKKEYASALMIVQQLKQMQPEDLDLVALALELRLVILQ